jgi:hypothetical protein
MKAHRNHDRPEICAETTGAIQHTVWHITSARVIHAAQRRKQTSSTRTTSTMQAHNAQHKSKYIQSEQLQPNANTKFPWPNTGAETTTSMAHITWLTASATTTHFAT